MKDNLIYLTTLILKKNKILFDFKELSFQIQSHPSYPSLHTVTGVLDHFNIDNIAANVSVTSETLAQLPDCFIAQIRNDNQKDLVLVQKIKLAYVVYTSVSKKQKVTKNEFLEKFTGIIVAVEKADEAAFTERNLTKLKYLSAGLLCLLGSFFLSRNSLNIYPIIYLCLSFIGVIASVAILKQELGLKTTIGDAFCSGTDEKKDCDAVLSSKGAEVIKGHKLSDFSILYFSGLTILTFIQISNPVLSFSISLLAIPITIYSLYYQYAVIKKWCLLCLSIVGILWAQALFPIFTEIYIQDFEINSILVFGVVAFAVILLWDNITPLFTEVHHLRKEHLKNVKFKKNYTLFESLLKKFPKINTQIETNNEIIFGNKESCLEIIIITSPFCGHCKPIHIMVESLLKRHNDQVKIIIRFNVNTLNKEGDLVKITSRLLEINSTKGEKECLLAMGDIYNEQKPNSWFKKWGECNKKEISILELEKQSSWCLKHAINFTPEILINGQSFPKEYERTDLVYFIEDLHESCCVNTIENINNEFELIT